MENLKSSLISAKTLTERAEILANFLSKEFKVNVEDIAILMEKLGALSFIWPSTLASCAVPIDLKSTAGKTFKEKKTFIFNKFAEVEHVSLFEKFVKDENFNTLPIQKIISAPFTKNTGIIGVIQVSRKGKSPLDCVDFNKDDGLKILELLKQVSGIF